MKKIKNLVKDIHKRVHLISLSILSGLIFIALLLMKDIGIIFCILITLGIFVLIVSLKYSESINDENFRASLEKKYGDDTDWKKYKELKKKFNNQ